MSDLPSIRIMAPLSGLVVKLSNVPDPVFAQKMVGDGIAIDPTDSVLRSPIDGEVVQLHPSHHAVAVRSSEGFSVLMHIGLETVQLKGKGFSPKVKVADRVKQGQPLIEFDMDVLASNAKSLITPIVIVDAEENIKIETTPDKKVKAGLDKLIEVYNSAVVVSRKKGESSVTGVSSRRDGLVMNIPEGLHARPAAAVVEKAKEFVSEIEIQSGGKNANAKSIVAMLSLGLVKGQTFSIVATGADGELALAKMAALFNTLADSSHVSSAKGSSAQVETHKSASKAASSTVKRTNGHAGHFAGIAASPGRAVGPVFQMQGQKFKISEKGSNVTDEREQFLQAQKLALAQLDQLVAQFQSRNDHSHAEIFKAHQQLLSDPEIYEETLKGLANGESAAFAWNKAIDRHAQMLSSLNNELLAQRAVDLRDVGNRLLTILLGSESSIEPSPGSVVISENLTPSQTAMFSKYSIAGFATVGGGPTSHVALLARSLGLPALAGVDPEVLHIADGETVLLDAETGVLKTKPSEVEIRTAREQNLQQQRTRDVALKQAHGAALTADGVTIPVTANIGGLQDAEEAVKLGADGVGLLRSEFLFLDRKTAPTEDEQYQVYQSIADALGPRPLTIRTLDIGGDKPLSYLPMPPEDNPFLGVRGIRLTLKEPQLMREQLRAILRVRTNGKLKVMFPMITTVAEVQEAIKMVDEECAKLKVSRPLLGIMVEVPSVALHIEDFAPYVDFFSIGTNDLTQYALAIDRGHPELSKTIDTLDKGVLRLIEMTAMTAKRFSKSVSVCGGLASDMDAVATLLSLGVDELSVSIASIPLVKTQVRKSTVGTSKPSNKDASLV